MRNILLTSGFVICFISLFAVNVLTLHNGHNWGDDFAQYILHAKNILAHRGYTSGIMIDNPVVYPPGYPLLLTPLLKNFGLDFRILKCINVIFWYGSILLLYGLFLGRMGKGMAMASCLLMAASSYFFIFKQNVLSDVPFLFFVILSVTTFTKYCLMKERSQDKRKRVVYLILFAASSCCAFWTRSIGVVLFLSAVFYFLARDRDWYRAVGAMVVGVGAFYIQTALIGIHQGYWEVFKEQFMVAAVFVIHNYSLVFSSLAWFFVPGTTAVTAKFFSFVDTSLVVLGPLLLVVIIVSSVRAVKKQCFSFYACFAFFYFWALVVWTAFAHSPESFSRYVLPLVGYVLMVSVEKTHALIGTMKGFFLHRIVKAGFVTVFGVVLAINIINIKTHFLLNDDVLFTDDNQRLFAWVKDNVGENESYVFLKPRAMALMTGRVGTMLWTQPDQKDHWQQRIDKLGVSYLIMGKNANENFMRYLEQNRDFSKVVWENGSYKIFKVL